MTTKTMMQLAWDNWHADIDPSDIPGINPSFQEGWERCAELHVGIDMDKLNADLIDYRNQIARLRVAIEAATKERDALKAENAGWLKSCNTLVAQRDALDKAARLALDALVDLKGIRMNEAEHLSVLHAIAALKAVLK